MGKSDIGIIPAEYFSLLNLNSSVEFFEELGRLSKDKKERYSSLLEKLKLTHSQKSKYTNSEKGKALEEVVTFLLESTSVFDVFKNLRTSTNEIDQLITLNYHGKFFRKMGWLDIKGDYFVCECKNYKKRIPATWIGKFYSLMVSTGCYLGIIFSYHGLTGQKWSDATGLTKILYLKELNEFKKVHIIEYSINDLEMINKGENFFSLLEKKIIALKIGIDFSSFIRPHPAEQKK